MVANVEGLKSQIKAIAGVVDIYNAWRPDGQGVTVAIYESQAAAEAASPHIQSIWGGLAQYLTGAPQTEVYENVDRMTG